MKKWTLILQNKNTVHLLLQTLRMWPRQSLLAVCPPFPLPLTRGNPSPWSSSRPPPRPPRPSTGRSTSVEATPDRKTRKMVERFFPPWEVWDTCLLMPLHDLCLYQELSSLGLCHLRQLFAKACQVRWKLQSTQCQLMLFLGTRQQAADSYQWHCLSNLSHFTRFSPMVRTQKSRFFQLSS